MMHVVPLVLTTTILIIVLCVRPSAISLCTDCTRWTRRSARPEPETPEEEERLLSEDGGQVASPRQDHQLLRSARDRIEELQRDLSTSVSQNAELQRRCETLSRDLEGARLFLDTADSFADAEVIQILQKLNAELQHIATCIVEHVISVFKLDVMTSDTEQHIVVNRASESIGSTLVQSLRTAGRDDSEIAMYFQIAFQAYLTNHLCGIVSSWTLDGGHNAFVNGTYQRLRDAEKQAISGRWRSLTRVYTLPTCVSDPNSFVTPVIAGLSDILLAAGCTASRTHITSELSSMFENKIVFAVSLAGRLHQMINGVVSGDFEVFVVRPGDTFRGETMEEDTDDDGGETQCGTGAAQTVLCTSDMGLTKRVQLETGEKETKTVIKAKVMFESFLGSEY